MIIRTFIIYMLFYLYKAYKKESINNDEMILIILCGINLLFIILIIWFKYLNLFLIKKEEEQAILIKNGVLNFSAIVKLNYSLESLFNETKKAGFNSFEEVDYAVLKNGVISFII